MPLGSDSLFPPVRRRSYVFITCFVLVAVTFISLLSSSVWNIRPSPYLPTGGSQETWSQNPQGEHDPYHHQYFLKGPPTERFRDNLLPNVKYITSWISAGWTNDVMTYINLIYLGFLTNRVPIVGMFTPSHIGGHVPPINFGDVFDVPRLAKALRLPVVEWHQVKNLTHGDLDELGCWNLWEAVQDREHMARRSSVPDLLKLDISYTTAPTGIKLIPRYEHDQHASFSSLAALSFPETRAENLVEPRASPYHAVKLPPDEQVLCYDYLYYVSAHQPFEFDFDFSPAWLFVGQHMHWTAELESITDGYIRRAFGTQEGQPTPPWISIHVRHGDFRNWCEGETKDCFAPISVIARRVEEVKKELLERKGLTVDYVIMTSDERDPKWWEEVTAQGWFGLDHSQTEEIYGPW
ncbi:hypothetical protein D9613_002247 [Agrocybe pediades]|uniref:Uncharacterized protein n=1 Tax=Agrocybe pediades TaxID=84607 RepID=A0A8H4R7Y5_9AGAR|nr:hypothetical protein D9613_002247 [Agrocybe pediades]